MWLTWSRLCLACEGALPCPSPGEVPLRAPSEVASQPKWAWRNKKEQDYINVWWRLHRASPLILTWRLEGTSGGHLVQPLQNWATQSPGPSPGGFHISPRREGGSTTSLGNPFHCHHVSYTHVNLTYMIRINSWVLIKDHIQSINFVFLLSYQCLFFSFQPCYSVWQMLCM